MSSLRKEFCPEFAAPLTDILNASLNQCEYPSPWKLELVTPVPKVPHPTKLKDLRKICSTSDFSKLFEGIIKQWILEDIQDEIDPSQFGDQKGTGTEHLIVRFTDRILKLLDSSVGKAAVIAASADWAEAFDRQCPLRVITKFIKMKLRPSLVTLLISYMSNRRMQVKFRGVVSTIRKLVGGSAQGSLLGGTQYIVGSNDVAEDVDVEDKYRYFDDIEIIDVILLSQLLIDYNFKAHVASDIGVNQKFLPPSSYNLQGSLDNILTWTEDNRMKLINEKSNFIIFTRNQTPFITRLSLGNSNIERVRSIKLLGVWISEDLSWDLNCQEMLKKPIPESHS